MFGDGYRARISARQGSFGCDLNRMSDLAQGASGACFYAKWMDGRIDNANTGWKGLGIWTTVGTRTPFHIKTGAGTTSNVVHFQMRPDPLAW
jgi:hypothetical protein